MLVSLTNEIARLENVDGQGVHDLGMAKKVRAISKIVMASSAAVWLIHCPGTATTWKDSTSTKLRKYFKFTRPTKTFERNHL